MFYHFSSTWPTLITFPNDHQRGDAAPPGGATRNPVLIQCYHTTKCDPLCLFFFKKTVNVTWAAFPWQLCKTKAILQSFWQNTVASVSFDWCDTHAVICVCMYLMRIGLKHQHHDSVNMFELLAMFEKFSWLLHQFFNPIFSFSTMQRIIEKQLKWCSQNSNRCSFSGEDRQWCDDATLPLVVGLLAQETTFMSRLNTADGCETNQRHVVRSRL